MRSAFARLWDAARTCPLGKNMKAKVKSNTIIVSGWTRSQIAMLPKKRFDPMNVSLWLGFAGANTNDGVFDILLESG